MLSEICVVIVGFLATTAYPLDIPTDVTPLVLNSQSTAPPIGYSLQPATEAALSAELTDEVPSLPKSGRFSKYDCDNTFAANMTEVLRKATDQSAPWRPLLKMANLGKLNRALAKQFYAFWHVFDDETDFYHRQCGLCTRYGKGFPCCIRERSYWVNRIMQARDEFVDAICKIATEHRVAPENCAFDAKHYDPTVDVAALLRCEAKCEGYNKGEALCTTSNTTNAETLMPTVNPVTASE